MPRKSAGSAAAQTVSMTLGRSVSRPGAPSVAPTSSARALFVLHCSGCHGRDGAGATDVPDMRQLGQFLVARRHRQLRHQPLLRICQLRQGGPQLLDGRGAGSTGSDQEIKFLGGKSSQVMTDQPAECVPVT